MSHEIVVLDGYAMNPGDLSWEPLKELGTVRLYDRTDAADTIQRIGNADIVLTNKVVIDEKVMDACPNMKYVGITATGVNMIDLPAAARHGICVTNVPAYSTDSVAEMTFALLLEMTMHTGLHNAAVQEGRWVTSPLFCFWDAPLTEIKGKTLGIIGYGSIGKAVAAIGRAFGMRVIANSPHGNDPCQVDLDTLLRESDIISLHCPLKADNRHLINRETIAKMKPGVLLINTARGPLVDADALKEALLSGRIGGVGMDVIDVEPMRPDYPLLGVKNCVITPHVAWATLEARQRLMSVVTENVRRFLAGDPQNCVH